MKNTILFLVLLLSSFSYCQKTIDIIKDFGKQKINSPKVLTSFNGNIILLFKDKKVVFDSDGNKIIDTPVSYNLNNPDLPSDDNVFGYDGVNDFYYADYKNKLTIISDFSKTNSSVTTFDLPVLEGLMGSWKGAKDKEIYMGSDVYKELKQSQFIGLNGNEIIYAASYISLSKNSHGTEKTVDNKYNTFVRVLYCNLKTKAVKEEIILKDIFNLTRSSNNIIKLEVLSSGNGSLKIVAVSGGNNTGVFSGSIDVYSLDFNSKELTKLNSTNFELPKGTAEVRADLSHSGLSILYNVTNGSAKNNRGAYYYKFKTDYSTELIEFIVPEGKQLIGINSHNLVFAYTSKSGKPYICSYYLAEDRLSYELAYLNTEGDLQIKKVGQKDPMYYYNPITNEEIYLELEVENQSELNKLSAMIESNSKVVSMLETHNWVVSKDGDFSLIKLLRYDVMPQEIKLKFIPVGKIN